MRYARGMTLLELLLATVISAMLMVGVMAVIVRVAPRGGESGRDSIVRGADERPAIDRTLDRVVELLHDDLTHATAIDSATTGGLVLTGYMGLVGDTLAHTRRPVRVVYRFERVSSTPWLIREQTVLDTTQGIRPQRELVCSGIDRIELCKQESGLDPVPLEPTVELNVNDGLVQLRTLPNPVATASRPVSADEDAQSLTSGVDSTDGAAQTGKNQPTFAWRLRLWTGPAQPPVVDRAILVQRGALP
ncbi:MAG: hypothetical protein GC164_02380 [Phycisphaera sp.]|nr:hypothetical protein [Phycisphaera sp.]